MQVPVSAQSKPTQIKNWAGYIQSAMLWNTYHGSRYVPWPVLPPNAPIRDLDFRRSRSFIQNSVSWSGGFYGKRRIVKNLCLSASIDYSERKRLYVFDEDTLQAYPPAGTRGIKFSRITDKVYNLEFSLMGEWEVKNWFIAAGGLISKRLRSTGYGVDLKGNSQLFYNEPGGYNRYFDTLIPRILIGYDGIGKSDRWRMMLGAERRRSNGNGRWVDIRFGIGVRLGR